MGVSAYVAKRTDGKIGDYFAFAAAPVLIIPVPDALAPFYTSGAAGWRAA
jgi:hypothetical protein